MKFYPVIAAIAVLCRAHTTTLKEASALIQQYAEAYASGEVIKALEQDHKRTIAILDGKVPS